MTKNLDSPAHARGESLFVDDIPVPAGTLHAAVYASPVAHGKIKKLDISKALSSEGVKVVLLAKDIPGENQIGNIIPDEVLLADKEVHFKGQPVALVIADHPCAARRAVNLIKCTYKEMPAVLDPREAFARGDLIAPARTFALGDVKKAFKRCKTVVAGRVESGGQEHVYLETQGALAIPEDNGRVKVTSGTQAPTLVQKIIARVLGKGMHDVEVDVKRLGGAFGGKEDQATAWAVMAALGASQLQKPVKFVLNRHEDMVMTGKRHPYSSDFKIGLDKNKKIIAYEATLYQNSGAAADLSTAILERTLFHSTNAYSISNTRVTAIPCRTNLAPFTAFRGFGSPQAMFVVEAAIAKAAEVLKVDASVIQKKNLLKEGDLFPYGMRVKRSQARRSFSEAEERFKLRGLKNKIKAFNQKNRRYKKGIACMPVCFGVSFTKTMLNQAGALVHVYMDGSVGVCTGAVEMGQGVNMKIRTVAARTMGLPVDSIVMESTNTTRIANTSPTAASSGADMNGRAAEMACKMIVDRLKILAADLLHKSRPSISIKDGWVCTGGKKSNLSFKKLAGEAYVRRMNLSAHAHYATPKIYFDAAKEKGEPFAYHVFGTAVTVATVDCLRGTYEINSVQIVHDAGKSINELIDRGQLEGGLMQGIGWVTMEELLYSDQGRLLTDTFSTYKVPDVFSKPKILEGVFLEYVANPEAVFQSKAIGEPPFMYGIGAYFALLNAMKAYRPEMESFYDLPMTPEKVLCSLFPPCYT